MKILMVGGGSGGHVFPLIAIQQELNKINPKLDFLIVSDKLSDAVKSEFQSGTEFRMIKSGKIRRFAHWKWYDYFKPNRYKFYIYNFIDLFKLSFGISQSLGILISAKPDIIFAKGGFVSVPVGFAASLMNIPLVLHDSDTRPGIASKLLAKRSKKVLLGMQRPNTDDGKVVGIPIRQEFFSLTKAAARAKLGFETTKPLLLITGGSLGAKRVNLLFENHLAELLEDYEIIHVSGEGDYKRALKASSGLKKSYKLYPFVTSEYPLLVAAADVVVGRAGATSIAEFAAVGVASIFIPNSYLTDQVSNTKWLVDHKAGIVIKESDSAESELMKALDELKSVNLRKECAHMIHKLAVADSAKQVSKQIIDSIES
ncbi:UDP-N-acetylglucosamine--N-acetylmuramyl-(pentapeptide) pyrophosphoryl-undecaprenol N-acetylglucosamine transferase [Candidatus Saccharibacteria bacterium]|nr:UDP-N-acetylglucosamine--N-acetylmuramyl-(pentapeptide) pyrophosphoryl-undecaprenol N-acetylglucosamine transferase [Candidatus Saccharibacteria bacterium]